MGNAGQLALLAAGYLLGKSKRKSIRNVLLVAGGVAYGRMTAAQSDDSDSSGSILGRLGSFGLADAAREAVTTTATKGMESLNKNLQSRSEALRNSGQTADESDEETEEESEDSKKATTKSTKAGES